MGLVITVLVIIGAFYVGAREYVATRQTQTRDSAPENRRTLTETETAERNVKLRRAAIVDEIGLAVMTLVVAGAVLLLLR